MKRLFGATVDESEQRFEELEIEAERARVIIEESRENVVVVDADLRVIAASRRARESIEGLEPGSSLTVELLEGQHGHGPIVVPYEIGDRREALVYLGEPGDLAAYEELRIDPNQVQAYVDGESAGLTPTEFRVLYALALERGRVVSRDELLQKLWGRREGHRDRTVDVFVRKLREKIDRPASAHTFLQTRYGVGYKLEAVPK